MQEKKDKVVKGKSFNPKVAGVALNLCTPGLGQFIQKKYVRGVVIIFPFVYLAYVLTHRLWDFIREAWAAVQGNGETPVVGEMLSSCLKPLLLIILITVYSLWDASRYKE